MPFRYANPSSHHPAPKSLALTHCTSLSSSIIKSRKPLETFGCRKPASKPDLSDSILCTAP